MKKRIAIIGAGISGLTLAQRVKPYADVSVFEKARGVGGRMSTRYAEPFYFDHGTQFFTARTKEFQRFLKPYMDAGTIAEWKGKVIQLEVGKKTTKSMWFEPHLVASPNMNSMCKELAAGLNIALSTEIASLPQKRSDQWMLHDKDGNALGAFDWVISTAPPAQTAALFHAVSADNTPFDTIRMQGCYALMIGFNAPWDKSWIAATVRDNPIQWIAINSSKPGRNNAVTTIVVHSRNAWADEHIDDDVQEAQKFLLEQFTSLTDISTSDAGYISTHRWKYAIVEEADNRGFYLNDASCIAATGDWASASRIEDAWINANSLADALTALLKG